MLGKIPEKADLIFLDPPYKEGLLYDCFDRIAELSLLSEDGIIVAEHAADEPLEDELAGYSKIKEKIYGKISISIYGIDLEEDT